MVRMSVTSEYDRLTHVVVGRAEGFHRDPGQVEVVNKTQADTAEEKGHPTEAGLLPEFAAFRAALEAHGVHVYVPHLAPPSVQDQTCPRDIGFVLGDTLVVAGMRHASRYEEFDGVRPFLSGWEGEVVEVPEGVVVEGGDVVIDGARVYVGEGQRSDAAGADFLRGRLGGRFEIVPVPCVPGDHGEGVLHLDCTFNPLGLGHALIHPPGIARMPDAIREGYDWIEVDADEAAALATNVISIAPDTLIARTHASCARVNSELRARGYTVVEVAFDGVPSIGGSFRCATMPVRREG